MPLLRRGPLHAFRALDAFRAEPVKRFRLKKKVKVDTCNSRRWRRGSLATPGTASKPEEKPSQSRRRTKQILPLLDWRQVSLPEDLSSRSYLETFISHIFKHMGSELKSHVAMTCACMVGCNPLGNSGEFRIGTVCSGSEMYMTALPFIVNQLRVACKTLPVTFVHAWACEYDVDKRVWIACNFDVPYIFEDVTTMSHPNGGMEHRTGKLQHPSPVHMIVGGTSCKDASRMSTLHSEMLTAVEDKKGTTGNTYDGLLDLVDVLDPPPDIVVLENVPSLKDKAKKTKGKPAPQYPSNFAAVQATLEQRGFQFSSLVFNSQQCHVPQRRSRLYMAACRPRPWFRKANGGRFDDHVQRNMQWLLRVVESLPEPSLHEFLLDGSDIDTFKQSWFTKDSEGKQINHDKCKEKKWYDVHLSGWDEIPLERSQQVAAQLSQSPWIQVLTERQRDLLALLYSTSPDNDDEVVWDLSQNWGRVPTATNAIPCSLPNAIPWLKQRCRPLVGVETMLLQGLAPHGMRALRPAAWPSRFLQHLGGNAFCVPQFVLWFLAVLGAM